MGGLRRARRGRSAEAAHPADHADQDAGPARGRLHRYLAASQGSDQPLRELRRRQLPEEVARTDPAQPRRLTRPDGRAGRERGRGTAHRAALPAAGSGGRYYADGEDTIHVVPDSRNIPVEFAESRWPFVVERLGLAVDSGGPGRYRGGLGYEKHIRMLRDAHFMSIADRSLLSCWGCAAAAPGGRSGSSSTRAAPTSAWSTRSPTPSRSAPAR